jgi:hypothetical protein
VGTLARIGPEPSSLSRPSVCRALQQTRVPLAPAYHYQRVTVGGVCRLPFVGARQNHSGSDERVGGEERMIRALWHEGGSEGSWLPLLCAKQHQVHRQFRCSGSQTWLCFASRAAAKFPRRDGVAQPQQQSRAWPVLCLAAVRHPTDSLDREDSRWPGEAKPPRRRWAKREKVKKMRSQAVHRACKRRAANAMYHGRMQPPLPLWAEQQQ